PVDVFYFFCQAEDRIRDFHVTGVQTCAFRSPEDPREALLFRLEEREFYYLPRIFRFAEDGAQSGIAVLLHNVTRIRWLDDVKTKIGRASCRERVRMSADAGAVRKKRSDRCAE